MSYVRRYSRRSRIQTWFETSLYFCIQSSCVNQVSGFIQLSRFLFTLCLRNQVKQKADLT